MRTCTECKKKKPLTDFTTCGIKEYPDRLRGECKVCVKLKYKKRAETEEHKEKRNAYMREYVKRPGIRERDLMTRRRLRAANPVKYMLINAKIRAKRDNVPFEQGCIGLEVPDVCPILNIPLKVNQGKTHGPAPDSPSLDKFIPELGYVKGNVNIISNKANIMKSNATAAEVQLLADWMKQQENLNETTTKRSTR